MTELLTVKDLTEVLKISRGNVYRLVADGILPAPSYALGVRSPRWRKDELEAWIDEDRERNK